MKSGAVVVRKRNIALGVSEQKRAFLEYPLLVNALKASLGSQFDKARPVFKKAKDAEEENEFTQKRTKFREMLTSELRELAKGYSSRDVGSERHVQTIRDLSKRMTESHSDILNGDTFLFGVAQKALNIHLKYLWCANLDVRPPHCPFDNDIISVLKPTSAFEHRWTYYRKRR